MDMPLDALTDGSDDALLALFANGGQSASTALTQRLTPRVLAHAYRLLGDRSEAEDVTQDALVRLWKMAPDWRQGESKVTTWLYRVVGNLCIDRMRKHRKRPLPLESVPDPADTARTVDETLHKKLALSRFKQPCWRCQSARGGRLSCAVLRGWPIPKLPELWPSALKRLKV